MNRICPTLITPKSSWMISKMQKIFIPWQSLPGTILQITFQQWGKILSISLQNNLFNFTTEQDKLHVLVFQVTIMITDAFIKKILYICENQSSFASLHSFLHLDSIGWGQEFNGRDLEFEQILEWNNFCRYRIVALFYRSFLLCCSIYVLTIILTWTLQSIKKGLEATKKNICSNIKYFSGVEHCIISSTWSSLACSSPPWLFLDSHFHLTRGRNSH